MDFQQVERDELGRPGNGSISKELQSCINDGTLVLFVGNGVRRVPTALEPSALVEQAEGAPPARNAALSHVGPSWQSYMESLWRLAMRLRVLPDVDRVEFAAFSRLTAPRQAEWFDRQVRSAPGLDLEPQDAAMLRTHLLGLDLHPIHGVPRNHLLDSLSQIILQMLDGHRSSTSGTIDVITTNVDCALEQNIAWHAARAQKPLSEIEVLTLQGTTARWRNGGSGPKVRLWKIHGCLSALAVSSRQQWSCVANKLLEQLQTVEDTREGEAVRWKAQLQRALAGAVPTHRLWSGSAWSNSHQNDATEASASVFSFSEYLSLLQRVLSEDEPKGAADTYTSQLGRLCAVRPMLFVGYDLHEVDVDVIALLHRSRESVAPRFALRYRQSRGADAHEQERLTQMGLRWWDFQLNPIGRSSLPGEMRLSSRHEWRVGQRVNDADLRKELDNAWRRALQQQSAAEWARRQQDKLRELLGDTASPISATARPRLVAAGLASIWHAFALQRPNDFPARRRVSAGLSSVDAQVPGGSGLVPVMVAAALAGPQGVGQFAFLSNVPQHWSQWPQIEEFCLSAGIDVRPLEHPASAPTFGRTSHVLLYDPQKGDHYSDEPRQRLILDVDEPLEPAIQTPGASFTHRVTRPRGFEASAADLLFADKLADHHLLKTWPGPVIFETGTSGTELLDQSKPPAIWTAGLGSFIRTLVCARRGERGEGGAWQVALPQTNTSDALAYLREDEQLAELLTLDVPLPRRGDEQQPSYIVTLNSFGKPLGEVGVTHEEELAFGKRIQDRWHRLASTIWEILDSNVHSRKLLLASPVVGRGVVVTLHEAGLFAYWEAPTGLRRSVIVHIRASNRGRELRFRCDTYARDGSRDSEALQATLRFLGEKGLLHVGADEPLSFTLAQRERRNTLGAGDTVRGCLAYGLWALFMGPERISRPRSLELVLLASAVLASLKCYAGSFVEFLRVVDELREKPGWQRLWGLTADDPASDRR